MLYLHEVTPEEIQYYPRIFLNEVFIGIHKDPFMFVRILKAHRRNALINIYTSISWNYDENIIHGKKSIMPRCTDVPIIIPLPKKKHYVSIYQLQKNN